MRNLNHSSKVTQQSIATSDQLATFKTLPQNNYKRFLQIAQLFKQGRNWQYKLHGGKNELAITSRKYFHQVSSCSHYNRQNSSIGGQRPTVAAKISTCATSGDNKCRSSANVFQQQSHTELFVHGVGERNRSVQSEINQPFASPLFETLRFFHTYIAVVMNGDVTNTRQVFPYHTVL